MSTHIHLPCCPPVLEYFTFISLLKGISRSEMGFKYSGVTGGNIEAVEKTPQNSDMKVNRWSFLSSQTCMQTCS
jgi:hypothetical protein